MILLDTHVLVWVASAPDRLSRRAEAAIRRVASTGEMGIASITLWEMAALFARGKLHGQGTVEACVRRLVEATRVVVKEITPEIAALAHQFPDDFSRDPADRLIAATARAEGLALVTRDERIRTSPLVKTIW